MKKSLVLILVFVMMFTFGACGTIEEPDINIEEPVEDDVIDKPVEDDVIDEPVEDDIIEEPVEDDVIDEPIEDDIIDEPIKDTHSPLYIEGLPVEDVIMYFNEVCLDGEYYTEGDPSVVQKWISPITFIIYGEYSQEDYDKIYEFVNFFNEVEGSPQMKETDTWYDANLRIYFGDKQVMLEQLGDIGNGADLDGAVTFWYSDMNEIYDEIICYRTEIDQYVRNSVILEELYNGLGPVQDTVLREDSIIYQYYTQPQELTQIDELIIKLLYHPKILCGMNAAECEEVIRGLYY